MDFDKWLNTLDWSARPTITNYKDSILQSIKQAKTDEEIMNAFDKALSTSDN